MATENTEPSNQTRTESLPQTESHHYWFPSGKSFFYWFITGTIGFICLGLSLTWHHIFSPELHVGDQAERDLVATHSALVVDEPATEQARQEARQSVMPVFKADASHDDTTLASVLAKLNEVTLLQQAGIQPSPTLNDLSTGEKLELLESPEAAVTWLFKEGADQGAIEGQSKIRAKIFKARSKPAELKTIAAEVLKQRHMLQDVKAKHPDVSADQLFIALAVKPADMQQYKDLTLAATKRMCKVFVRLPTDSSSAWQETAVEFMPEAWSPEVRSHTSAMICSVMQSNIVIDRAATDQKAERTAKEVMPKYKNIAVGQMIVSRKGIITEENLKVLQALGITKINRFGMILGLWVSLAAAVALVGLFLYAYDAKQLFATSSLGLMYTVAIGVLALASVLGKTYPQIVPLPAGALILTIFFGRRVAVAVTLPLAIFLAVDRLLDFQSLVALGTAAGAAIGTYSKRRHALVSAGLVIGVAQALGYLAALAVTQFSGTATSLGKVIGLQFAGGITSAIAAIGSLPFLENMFGMLTPFRLAELTDADQPLLRKLEENAPGTYQHSLAVANLAEAGARAIGADVNLVRAGAFYHDVGKMMKPKYFIENQLGDKNPHDSMQPEDSRARVLAHVTDGLILAKEYKLPKAVQDFIPMHQGTSLMAYFYHKACVRDGADNVDPMFYRYPGPKPQSKETAIVMLADVSEAVTHAMKDPSEEEVEAAMAKVFQNRWDDEQFSEASLTYNELMRIRKAFVRVWRTLHHERLKYPSTTTGRMPVVPDNLPRATGEMDIPAVAAHEFPAGIDASPPVPNPTNPEGAPKSTRGGVATESGDPD